MKSAALAVVLLVLVAAAALLFGPVGFAVALVVLVAWMAVGRSVVDPLENAPRHLATRPDPVPGVTGETLIAMDAHATHRRARIMAAQERPDGSGES
jgi:hypothetical protein